MRVTRFNTPDKSVKSVYVFYTGRYPKKTKPSKDVTLPIRLWPDAKYIIRCETKGAYGVKNKEYFKNLYGQTEYELVDQSSDWTGTADMLFIHHENYNAYGGILSDTAIDFSNITRTWLGKITVFYNDELFSGYYDLRDYVEQRAKNNNFLVKNPGVLDKVIRKTDWSNVTLLVNEDKVSDWGNEHITHEDIRNQITLCYLSDIILYDLNMDNVSPKSKYDKRGVYIPLFTQERINTCNKLFSGALDITFAGSKSDDLKPEIAGDGKYIQNHELAGFLRQWDWTIYIGKGRASSYLGATFYEPILNGIPVFVWTKTDPDKRVFGDLDCYFSTETELAALVNKWDMAQLHSEQVKRLQTK
jgi:hypothetical protein